MEDRLVNDVISESADSLAAYGINSALLATSNKVGQRDKFFKKLVKRMPLANIPFMIEDGLAGANNVRETYNTTTPTWQQELAATIGGLANGASLGVIPAKEATLGLYSEGQTFKPNRNKSRTYDKKLASEILDAMNLETNLNDGSNLINPYIRENPLRNMGKR